MSGVVDLYAERATVGFEEKILDTYEDNNPRAYARGPSLC